MSKKSVRDIDVAGKAVLTRVDYNVPFEPGTRKISDDGRIRASLPTLRYLRDRGCKIILCSHLGRPKGRVDEGLRMAPVTERLSQLLEAPVRQADDCVGEGVRRAVESLSSGEVIVLENLRFHSGEERNDPRFASELASLAEVYVDDAFGTAHRAHASTEGVTRFLPSVAGLLLAKEVEMLGRVLESPERPCAAILGGAKVSDKIAVLENLAGRVDVLIIGGGMAATFLKAKGLEVGDSSVEDDCVSFSMELLARAHHGAPNLLIPEDVVVADSFDREADCRTVDATSIEPGWRVMDIGPRTARRYVDEIGKCKTVVWNGPMGVFEWERFAEGTVAVGNAVASLTNATTVVGGGSTAEAVQKLGLAGKMTHVSTGGGASLEFMEGKVLPGVAALMDRE
ncbi:MAG: phosphoglycerate kinase [Chloroflexi bacterium]|nr:phosphoglycerate kinase [Chloroflexota bacterium]